MVYNTPYTDTELLERMALDDHQAFDILYNRYWKRVLQFAISKSGDIMEGENIVQDVFVSLWNRRGTLTVTSCFENYLMVSIKYRVIKFLNKQRAERLSSNSDSADFDLIDDSTQQHLEFEELRKRLEIAIGKLPDKCRIIYQLNKVDGLSYREIADKLDITEKSVDAHLYRAKKSILSDLKSYLSVFLL
jgi:RNA polymerase sigma-70 factor (family 1)